MASAAQMVARIRANGSNVELNGDKLRVVNKEKLPAGAMDYIRNHSMKIAEFIATEADEKERLAIMQEEAGLSPRQAEFLIRMQMVERHPAFSPEDWQLMLDHCAQNLEKMGRNH